MNLLIEMNNKNKALKVAPDNVHNVSISTGAKSANVNAMIYLKISTIILKT